MNDIELLNCLPPPLREIKEYRAIMSVQQPHVDEMFFALFSVLTEKNIQTASEIGISVWERFLRIKPLSTDSLEDRRFRVSSMMYDDSKMNYYAVIKKITALCGEGNFEIDYRPDEYYFGLRVALRSRNAKTQALEFMEDNIPANIILFIDFLYTTYGMLEKLRYGELEKYSFEDIRQDAEFIELLGG